MHNIHGHANTYFSQVIYVTSHMRATFLPIVGSFSCRYSSQEATPELGMIFTKEGNVKFISHLRT